MDLINAFPTVILILSAIAAAYLFCAFLDSLAYLNGMTIAEDKIAQLDQEFEKAKIQIEELRQNGENHDGRDGTKVDQ